MESYEVHVCMVSDHPLPNLLPILQAETRPKQVVLLVSDAKRNKAELLSANLRDLGCQVELRAVSAWRIEDIRETLVEVLEAYEDATIALNATGGTKVMALGAVEVFYTFGKPVFYVDTSNDSLMLLGPQPVTLPFPDQIRVKSYLRSYGYRIENQSPRSLPPARRELGHWLVENSARLSKALATLNWHAALAEKGLSAAVADKYWGFKDFGELVGRFKVAGVLDYDESHLVFPDDEARQYVNGGWLEQYVFGVLQGLKKEQRIFDWMGNVEVVSAGGVRNELDVAFTARNRLHLIECKTANLAKDDDRAAGTTYKLEALRDLMGGIFGRAMLVSYQPLVKADLRRCREYKIQVIQSEQLTRLREHLIEWVKNP